MILTDNFPQATIRSKIQLTCDYCNSIFNRTKKSILRSYKNLKKDACPKCANLKRREVSKLLHGNENYFETQEFKEKHINNYFTTDEFKKKRKATLLEKYGVESPLQSEEIRKKQSNTIMERYGVANYSQSTEFVVKPKTSKQKVDIQDKRVITCQQRYGTNSYVQTEEYWEKRKKTCKERYGVEHPHQNPEIVQKMKNTTIQRYGVDSYPKLASSKQHYRDVCVKKYGVPNPLCLQQNRIFGQTQQDITVWLNSFGFSFTSDYDILNGKEIDIYDNKTNIAIEYCGLYWHNECSPEPRDNRYHYQKYAACLNKGINLITIFEDEWKSKNTQCKSIILSKLNKSNVKIGGRSCKSISVDKKEALAFLQEHHLLGVPRHSLLCVGLRHKNDLVAVMSLGRHPRNSKTLVMDRMCFKSGYHIVGGASKLFNACLEQVKCNSIITWSDNRWSNGDVYEKIGFTLDANLPPDYSYVNVAKPYNRISKQSQKKKNTNCPNNKTEHEFALEHGLARIWDCGKKRWKFNI